MIVRALDVNHDWQFGKGRNDYKQANDAVAQMIETNLLSFLGDCFFDISAGIDWFNLLGGKDQLSLELAIRTTILNTAGVTGIVDATVDLDPNTRLIRIGYQVNTVYTGVSAQDVVLEGLSIFLVTQDGLLLTTEDGTPISTG